MSSGEGPLGWIRIGCGTGFVAILPLWGMLTALLLYLNPAWQALDARIGLVIAGLAAGFWLALAGAIVAAILLAARGFSRAGQARALAQRRALDAELAVDAALPEDAWGEAGAKALSEMDDFTDTEAATEEADW